MWAGLAVDNTRRVGGDRRALRAGRAGRWAVLAKTCLARPSSASSYSATPSTGPRADRQRTSPASRSSCGRSFPSSSSASLPSPSSPPSAALTVRCTRTSLPLIGLRLQPERSLPRSPASPTGRFCPAFAGVGLRTNLKDLVGQGWRAAGGGHPRRGLHRAAHLGPGLLELQPRSRAMSPNRVAALRSRSSRDQSPRNERRCARRARLLPCAALLSPLARARHSRTRPNKSTQLSR